MITNKIIIELILAGVSANAIDTLANNCPKFKEKLDELIEQKVIRRGKKNYFIVKKKNTTDDEVYNFVVNEMIPMFKQKKPDIKALAKETTKRLKKVMSNHGLSIDVIRLAVKLYLNNTPDKYVRYPHYFVYKHKGNEMHSDLLNMIDLIRTNTRMNRDIKFEL